MSLSGTPRISAIEESLSNRERESDRTSAIEAARFLRASGAILLYFQLAYVVADLWNKPSHFEALLAYHVVNFGLAGLSFALTWRRYFTRYSRLATMLFCLALMASGLNQLKFGSSIEPRFLSVLLFSVASAAFMPWSAKWQGVLNIGCLASFVVDRAYAAHADANDLYDFVGLMLILTIAQVFASMIDRRRRSLIAARDAAEQVSSAKSQFLASMSHEMRTPLNAIIGMADLLAETTLSGEQREYVRICRSNGATLLTLISDLLDLSKVEAGQLELEQQPFELLEVLDMAHDVFAIQAREKNLELDFHVAPNVPEWFVGDPLRLRQVISNLLSNAIKFTEKGGVELGVSLDGVAGAEAALSFEVSDSGIGIPAERAASIFEAFSQVDASITRRYGGTGLGLAIAKRLIELMGGKIGFESREGIGSRFFFTVKMKTASQEIRSQLQEAAIAPEVHLSRPITILLAEDSQDNRALIHAYLRDSVYSVDSADDGETAVQKFRDGTYAVVLMDMQMPVMDGYRAARAMRAWERAKGRMPTPIIAITADAFDEDRQKALAAGCDAHLAKPLRKNTLVQTIMSLLESGEARPDTGPKFTPEAAAK